MSETLELHKPRADQETGPAVVDRGATSPRTETLPQPQPLEIPLLSQVTLESGTPLSVNPALFDSVSVQAQIVLGQVQMNFGQLMRLSEGELLKSNRLVQQPVDILVNGNLVARGELVAVGEHFGVRVTQIQADGAA